MVIQVRTTHHIHIVEVPNWLFGIRSGAQSDVDAHDDELPGLRHTVHCLPILKH